MLLLNLNKQTDKRLRYQYLICTFAIFGSQNTYVYYAYGIQLNFAKPRLDVILVQNIQILPTSFLDPTIFVSGQFQLGCCTISFVNVRIYLLWMQVAPKTIL